MNYENEKYNHIKDFWKIDKSISALFWEYEHLGFSQCIFMLFMLSENGVRQKCGVSEMLMANSNF